MVKQVFLTSGQQLLDDSGKPLEGGKIYTYDSGTTTARATYTDASGDVKNSNPVILDSEGRASIWFDDDQAYRIVVKDKNDVDLSGNIDNLRGRDLGAIQSIGAGTVTVAKLADLSQASILGWNSSGVFSELALGANLSISSGSLAASTVASQRVLLDRSVLSAASSYDLSTSIIDKTAYNTYLIEIYGLEGSTASNFYFQWFTDNLVTNLTTHNLRVSTTTLPTASSDAITTLTNTALENRDWISLGNIYASQPAWAKLTLLFDIGGGVAGYESSHATLLQVNTSPAPIVQRSFGYRGSSGEVLSARFYPFTGTFSGTAYCWGLKAS